MSRKSKNRNSRPDFVVATSQGMLNAATTLLANIQFSSIDEPIQVIAVTSSVPNEGKTTAVMSLANAIGQAGMTCLLIEGDMRRRSLATALHTRTIGGIHGVLTGDIELEQALVATRMENVTLLNSEPGILNPASVISSKRFDELMIILRERYDYIIIDSPPVGAFVDAALIASKADGTLLVVRENFTERKDAISSIEQLEKANANVIGTVLNFHDAGDDGYYYSYYYEEKMVPADSPEAKEALRKSGAQGR